MQQTYAAPVELYGGFWRRLAALIIDGIIISIPLDIILAPLAGGLQESNANAGHGLIRGVVFLLYYAFMESSSYQATLGKMALGIQVTDLQGGRLTFARALGRNAAKYISAIICLVGFIMAAFTQRKQALHDMIAGTLVVRKEAVGMIAGTAAPAGYSPYGAPPPPPSGPPPAPPMASPPLPPPAPAYSPPPEAPAPEPPPAAPPPAEPPAAEPPPASEPPPSEPPAETEPPAGT